MATPTVVPITLRPLGAASLVLVLDCKAVWKVVGADHKVALIWTLAKMDVAPA